MGSVKNIGIIDVVSKRVDECSLTLSVYIIKRYLAICG